MRSYLVSIGYLLGLLAAIIALEALFAAWWGLDTDESSLPLMAAALVAVAGLLLLRRRDRSMPFDMKWARGHAVASSAILALAFFLFSLVWGAIGSEPWTENVGWSAGGASAIFALLVVIGYAERFIREREARKRGVAVEDYAAGRLARGIAWMLGAAGALFLLLVFVAELTLLWED